MTGVDHPEMFEMEVLNGDMHGTAAARSVGVFELKPIVFACATDQKVKLRAAVGCPEVDIAAPQRVNDLLQREAFPRRAELGVRLEIGDGSQLKKSVQESAVAEVDFWGFDLALSDVFKPGRKDSHHIGAREDVEVTSRGVLGGAEGSGELRRVPNLTVVMGNHGPKASEGFGRDRDAKLGDIAFEKSSDKVATPGHARSIIGGKKRQRKTAAEPELIALCCADFLEIEPAEIDEAHAASQRFGHPFDKRGRGRAEYEKPHGILGPINQYSQQLEEIRPPLDLVDDYQAAECFHCSHGRRQPADIDGVLKIEIGARLALGDQPGERSFTALARTQKGGNGVNIEDLGNTVQCSRSRN